MGADTRMKHTTSIEWTHVPGYIGATLNPIRARNKATGKVGHFCVHVSEGCRNCYAERLQPRFGNPVKFRAQERDKVDVFLDEEVLKKPLRWRKPHAIFVCDMTDVFGEWVPDEWIDRIFAVAALCPQHIFMVLTKRAARMQTSVTRFLYPALATRVLENIWLGASIENRAEKGRIDILRNTPAMVRFLSIEPLLEDIGALGLRGISWVIVGGESGPHARPFDLAWARDIIDQCRAASVPVFVKQIGSRPCGKWGIASEHLRPDDPWWTGKSRKGGDPSEWPADLRVREFP